MHGESKCPYGTGTWWLKVTVVLSALGLGGTDGFWLIEGATVF